MSEHTQPFNRAGFVSYQPSTPFLASQFCDDLQAFARHLHAVVPRDDADSAFLQDVARGRYPMVALQRLMQIAARSPKAEHREMLSEMVRPLGAAPCIVAAWDAETESTGIADVHQRQFDRAPCKSTWQRARESLLRQLSTTRQAYDALMATRHFQ